MVSASGAAERRVCLFCEFNVSGKLVLFGYFASSACAKKLVLLGYFASSACAFGATRTVL